jgi:hypothetical protein
MTPIPVQTPAPQAAAAPGPAHDFPARPGGRVRNRRDRQRAARSAVHTAEPGADPVRIARSARTRRPEPFKALTLEVKALEVPPPGARPAEARRSERWSPSAATPAAALAPSLVGSGSGTVESP